DLGQVTCATEPYLSSGSAAYYTKSYYDDLGRMVRAVTPAGTVTTTDYDKLSVTVTRNAVASQTATNENQTVTTYKNLRGQDIQVTNGKSDVIDNTITFKYDASGNLLESYAPSAATATKVVMTYDKRGNKRTMTDPDMGYWQYEYDSYGRLIEQTDAKGQVTTMQYDLLDRMTSRTTDADDAAQAQTSNWYYTTNANAGDYDEIGTLSLEVAYNNAGNEVSRRAYYYDDQGRLFVTLDKVLVEGLRYKYFYTQSRFDQYGRPTHAASFWRPIELEASEFNLHYGWSSFVQKTTYNQKGFVLKVEDTGQTDGGAPRTLWSAPKYNIYGQLEEYTMGGRVVVAQEYDEADRTLEQITASNDTASYQHMTFDFDKLGNVVSRADNRRNLAESFTYDEINRLKTNTVSGGASYTLSNNYDNLGNITSRQVLTDAQNNTESLTYTYGGSRPHAVTQVSGTVTGTFDYDYDANGAMHKRKGSATNVTWTAFNKVGTITDGLDETTFAYDAGHNRITQTVKTDDGSGGQINKRRTIYAAGVEQVENYDTAQSQWHTARTRVYIGTPAGTIGVYAQEADKTNNLNYFLKDHLGSVVEVLKGVLSFQESVATAIVESFAYGAWGEYRDTETWGYKAPGTVDRGAEAVTERGFTGHEMLDEVGLVHMNGRIYDAFIGRFLSADPFVQSPGNLQSYNRYTYVANNPLSFTDPSGFFLSGLFKSIGNFFKKFWKPIVAIVVAAVFVWAAGPTFFGVFAANSFWGPVATGAVAGALSGAIVGGAKGALFGALSGAVFGMIGGIDFEALLDSEILGHLAKAASHGVTGGGLQEAQGGEFLAGFSAAGFTALASPGIEFIGGDNPDLAETFGEAAAAAVVGGTASILAGGKFENGAVTGAFSHLFNNMLHGRHKNASETKKNSNAMTNKQHGRGLNPNAEEYGVYTLSIGGNAILGVGGGGDLGIYLSQNSDAIFGYDIGVYSSIDSGLGYDLGAQIDFSAYSDLEVLAGGSTFGSYSALGVGATHSFDANGNHGGYTFSIGPQLGGSVGGSNTRILFSTNSSHYQFNPMRDRSKSMLLGREKNR
ncbi:MAG: RHS repeat-associated core domain-containing protein, partial [Verrucomicrobiota bacterium]